MCVLCSSPSPQAVTGPAIHAMWGKWAPPAERSRLATITYSGELNAALFVVKCVRYYSYTAWIVLHFVGKDVHCSLAYLRVTDYTWSRTHMFINMFICFYGD